MRIQAATWRSQERPTWTTEPMLGLGSRESTTHLAIALTTLALALSGCASRDWTAYGYDNTHFSKQPNESTERTDMTTIARELPAHESIPESTARTALIFRQAIQGLSAHIEVRDYYVSQGRGLTLTAPSEAVFEVRSGRFEVTTLNETGERGTGQMWTTLPGEHVTVRTLGETAILRAIYVVKN